MPLSKAKSGLQSLSAIRRSPVSLVPRFRFRSRQSMRMQGLHRLGSFDAPPAAKPGGSVMLQDKEIIAPDTVVVRSEEHTSELQSLMRISYAVFCLKKKNK